jgi:hypothetical protein
MLYRFVHGQVERRRRVKEQQLALGNSKALKRILNIGSLIVA